MTPKQIFEPLVERNNKKEFKKRFIAAVREGTKADLKKLFNYGPLWEQFSSIGLPKELAEPLFERIEEDAHTKKADKANYALKWAIQMTVSCVIDHVPTQLGTGTTSKRSPHPKRWRHESRHQRVSLSAALAPNIPQLEFRSLHATPT